MLPSEVYQLQHGVKSQSNMKSPAVTHFISSSYKSNPFQNHQLFRQACHQTKHLYSKRFNVSSVMSSQTPSHAYAFSKNGDFFVTSMDWGTVRATVALLPTVEFMGISNKLKPTLTMDFKHKWFPGVSCLTTSPDDGKLFSNGDREIAIHDVHT